MFSSAFGSLFFALGVVFAPKAHALGLPPHLVLLRGQDFGAVGPLKSQGGLS